MRYTSGPLVAGNKNALRAWCIYRQFSDGSVERCPIGQAETEADATLWAAAPDLLRVCEELLARELEVIGMTKSPFMVDDVLVSDVRSVIERATGVTEN